jgi:hypothetical protein
MNEKFTVRQCVAGAGAYILLAAAFPRINRVLLWGTRLGPRGLLIYAASDTLLRFGISYLHLHAKRTAEERDRLKEKLGREPTDDELADHFGYGPNS